MWHVDLVDKKQDGRLEIVNSNAAGQIRVRDRQGKILSQAKPSSYFSEFSLCRWPTLKDRVYALMWAEDKTIRLFDFDGKMAYLYDCYKSLATGIAEHATAVRARGAWIPVAWPHDGHRKEGVIATTTFTRGSRHHRARDPTATRMHAPCCSACR